MRKNSHDDKANDKVYIEKSASTNTLNDDMILKINYQVDFRRYESINSLSRFQSKLHTSEFNESENMVNILIINSLLVNIDIILGSYVNGSTKPTIYLFFSNVSTGNKIIENPHNLLYLSITSDTIYIFTIWLTDKKGNELN